MVFLVLFWCCFSSVTSKSGATSGAISNDLYSASAVSDANTISDSAISNGAVSGNSGAATHNFGIGEHNS